MNSFFDRLNLRPQERRLVVIVGLIIFVLLNMWFVWPYFDDWGQVQGAIQKSRNTLERYEKEIARRAQYEGQLRELETTGSEMLSNELELQRIVQSQAAANGLQITSMNPRTRMMGSRTNQFFHEQGLSVAFTSDGKELVNFLVGIAANNSMVRVSEMNVNPDPSQTRLTGSITFIGNYQRATNSTGKAAAPARKST